MYKKSIKILLSCVFIFASIIFSSSVSNAADKKSDTEKISKEHLEKFGELKMNSTIEEVAKIIYGKKYKEKLKKENGITVFKKKELVKGIDSSTVYYYSFFTEKVVWNKTSVDKMIINLSTKKNGKTLYLTGKIYAVPSKTKNETGVRESEKYLENNKVIKKNMSTKDLDKILAGKGLGNWSSVDYSDFSKTGIYSDESKKLVFPKPSKSKHYQFRTKNKKTVWQVSLIYNEKKKDYVVEDCYVISI